MLPQSSTDVGGILGAAHGMFEVMETFSLESVISFHW